MSMHAYFFVSQTEWKGGRQGVARGEQTPLLEVSAPVEFQGKAGFWTPESLLVAAAEVCLMETFLAMSEWSHLNILGYRSTAQGKLEKVEGSLRFTEITIRPQVEVAAEDFFTSAERVMTKAKDNCLISHSLRTTVKVEPSFHAALVTAPAV